MLYVLVKNLTPQGGGMCDYKGIDIESIVPGSQCYAMEENSAAFAVDAESLPDHTDITALTESQYNAWVEAHKTPTPVNIYEQVQELRAQNAQMMLSLVINDLI